MSRILIVEDEEAIADLEKDYLELSDFEVATFGVGIARRLRCGASSDRFYPNGGTAFA